MNKLAYLIMAIFSLFIVQFGKTQDSLIFRAEYQYQGTSFAQAEDAFWNAFFDLGLKTNNVYFLSSKRSSEKLIEMADDIARDKVLYPHLRSFEPLSPTHHVSLSFSETPSDIRCKVEIIAFTTMVNTPLNFTLDKSLNQISRNRLREKLLGFFSKIDNSLSGHNVLEKAFPNNTSSFEVLVLPFKSIGSCQDDAGFCIQQGLHELNINNELNLDIVYYENYQLSPNHYRDEYFIKSLLEYHNAEMIIYGEYYEGEKLRFYYYTKENPHIQRNQNIKVPTQIDASVKDLLTISSGQLQGDVNFIIHWLAALSASKQSDYKKASELYEYILSSLDSEVPVESKKKLLKEIITTYVQVGNFELTFSYIDIALQYYTQVGYTLEEYVNIMRLKAYNYISQGNYYLGLKTGCECLRWLHEDNVTNGNTLAETLLAIQLSYGYLGENEKAIEVGNEILGLDIDTLLSTSIIPVAHLNIGAELNNYFDTSRVNQALLHFNWVMQHALKKIPVDKGVIAGAHRGIATAYTIAGDINLAKQHYLQAAKIEEELFSASHPIRGITYFNLGSIYQQLSVVSTNPLEFNETLLDSALIFHTKGYEVNQKANSPNLAMIHAMEGMGIIHTLKGDLEKAIEISTQAYEELQIVEKHELDFFDKVEILDAEQFSENRRESLYPSDKSTLFYRLGCDNIKPTAKERIQFFFIEKRVTLCLNTAEISRRLMVKEEDIQQREVFRMQGIKYLEEAEKLFQNYSEDHHMHHPIKTSIELSRGQFQNNSPNLELERK